MMNYCTSMARSSNTGDQLIDERQSVDNDNDNKQTIVKIEQLAATNRVGDLLKLTHLRLSDSQPDERQFKYFNLSDNLDNQQHRNNHHHHQHQHRRRNHQQDVERNTGERCEFAGRGKMLSSLGEQRQDELSSQLVEANNAIALVEHDDVLAGQLDHFGQRQQQQVHPQRQQQQQQHYEPQQYGFLAANYQSAYPAKLTTGGPEHRYIPFESGDMLMAQQEALHGGAGAGAYEFLERRCASPRTSQHEPARLHHRSESIVQYAAAASGGSPLTLDAYSKAAEQNCVYTSLDHHPYRQQQQQHLMADSSLPEEVMRLNYQQEAVDRLGQQHVCGQCHLEQQQQQQQHQHQQPFQILEQQQQQQMHYRASSSMQSEPSLINLESAGQQQQQQLQHLHLQQDSGHVSSVSCIDSGGSDSALLLLAGDNSSAQQQQLQVNHRAAMLSSSSINLDVVGSHSTTNSNYHMQSSAGSLISGSHSICGNSHHQNNYFHHHHHHHLNHHLQHDHQQANEPELKFCAWEGCENTFLDMGEFVRHLEEGHVNQAPKEKNRYYCLWAGCKRNEQEFNARYKLLIHMRVHSGEKPYPCSNANCKKSFSRLENLKIHVRSHTGEKPYKCSFDNCSKSFTNSSDRIKHHKTHKDPKPYSCNYASCAKRYTDPSSLRKHLRAHKRISQPETSSVAAGATARLARTGSEAEEEEEEEEEGLASSASGAAVICAADFNPDALLQSAGCEQELVVSYASDEFDQVSGAGGTGSGSFWTSASDTNKLLAPASWSEQQDSRFSRSWCAGSTMGGGGGRAASQVVYATNHAEAGSVAASSSCGSCLAGSALPSGRLLAQQHQVLGRSLPPTCSGGAENNFRVGSSPATRNLPLPPTSHESAVIGWQNCDDSPGQLASNCQSCCQNSGRAGRQVAQR